MKSYGPVAVIETTGKGRGIVATRRIREGETILEFVGKLLSRREVRDPNAALQLDEDLFLESKGAIDERLNHGCSPNCYIDFQRLALVALKGIHEGAELTFDYTTSEYDLIDQGCSFTCLCGAHNCIREVKGYRYLPVSRKREIEPFLSPFLKRKWEEENGVTPEGTQKTD
jgi:SET domain-containing protein